MDISKYLVRNPKQVHTYLKMLSEKRCLISAAFGEKDKDTFLTAILDIDSKKQTITLDCGPREYLNKRLLDSAIIKCSTEYEGIKVHFEGRKVKKSGSPTDPSFTIPIPSFLYWIQRRQFYRIKSPLSKNSFCSITLIDPQTEEPTTLALKLHDLSANGLSFILETPELSDQLTPSTVIENCRLVLENEESLSIDCEVRHKMSQNPNNLGKTERIGCSIVNVSPRIESTVLRYMQNIEREIKQKEK